MIILYIPFEKHAAGDLTYRADMWKANHCLNSSEKITTLYYLEDIDDDQISPNTTVFVLAHGAKTDPTIVANCSDPKLATIIDIETLASRFNCDFLAYADKLTAINLYCCGDGPKNALLAKTFQAAFLRPEYSKINYFDGTIHYPDQLGRFWSTTSSGHQVPAIATSLSPSQIELNDTNKNYSRQFVKTKSMHTFFEHAKDLRKDNYHDVGSFKKTKQITNCRGYETNKQPMSISSRFTEAEIESPKKGHTQPRMTVREKQKATLLTQARTAENMTFDENKALVSLGS